MKVLAYRCIHCGDVIDQKILLHRLGVRALPVPIGRACPFIKMFGGREIRGHSKKVTMSIHGPKFALFSFTNRVSIITHHSERRPR